MDCFLAFYGYKHRICVELPNIPIGDERETDDFNPIDLKGFSNRVAKYFKELLRQSLGGGGDRA